MRVKTTYGSFLRYISGVMLLAGIWFVSSEISSFLIPVEKCKVESTHAMWLPAGLSFAFLFMWGLRYAPGVWLGVFFSYLIFHQPLALAASVAVAATIQPALGAYLTKRVTKSSIPLADIASVMWFVICAAIVASAISAMFASALLWKFEAINFGDFTHNWMEWCLDRTTGVVLIAPIIIAWTSKEPIRMNLTRAVEALIIAVLSGILGFISFDNAFYAGPLRILYLLILPLTILATVRFGPRGSTATIFIFAAIALAKISPSLNIAAGDPDKELLRLDIVVATLCVTTLMFAATIAERTKAAYDLKESSEKFRTTFERAAVGVVNIAPNGRFLRVNQRFCDITGYSLEEILNMRIEDITHPDDLSADLENTRKLLDGSINTFSMEKKFIRKDGSPIWTNLTSVLIRNEKNRPDYFVSVIEDINDKKLAEQALHESHRKISTLLSNMIGMAYRCCNDPNWTMQFLSEGCYELTGYRPWELIGNSRVSYSQIIHPEDRPRIWDEVQEALATKRPFESQYRIITKDGREKWVLEHGQGILSAGKLEALEGVVMDITQYRHAQEEIESIARFPQENPDPILRINREGLLIYANPAAGKLLADWKRSVGESLPENYKHEFLSTLTTGLKHEIECSCGKTIYSMAITPVIQGDYVNIYARDITERKVKELQLRKSRELLQRERDFEENLIQTAQTIIVILDTEGSIVKLNRFAQQLTGYSEEEVAGKKWFDLFIPPHEKEKVRNVFKNSVDGQRTRGYINPILARDGKEIMVRWYDSELHDERGRLAGILAIGHDITEIRQKEEMLQQAQKLEAVGQLAGGIAHDFNNQMTVVKGYCDLMLKKLPESNEAYNALQEIRGAAIKATKLTSQLLAFSRKQPQHLRKINLSGHIAEMFDPLSRMIGENMKLVIHPSDDLPLVEMDPMHMEQIVMNLVVNARDAMPAGGTITIETAAVKFDGETHHGRLELSGDRFVKFSVSDTGTGMDEETVKHIFEPFFTTKPVGAGTGLGLATVYGLVKQNHGDIEVLSTPGKGTSFNIYLPAVLAADAQATTSSRVASAETLHIGNETILLVEDSEKVREYTARVLKECGYTLIQTGSARDALTLSQQYPREIHLLVTDMVMPEMDGIELNRRLQDIRPGIKTLFISGYSHNVLQKQVTKDPIKLLPKPFSPEALAVAVREALDGPMA